MFIPLLQALVLCSSVHWQVFQPTEYSDLHDAAREGNVQKVRELLEEGADPSQADDFSGWTPLHYALISKSRNREVVQLLLDHGAQVNAIDEDGTAPIHLAASDGRPDLLRMLLTAGAEADLPSSQITPLMCFLGASRSSPDRLESARLLIDFGATIDRHDRPSGPLQWAARYQDAEMIDFLLQHGGDIGEVDADGNSLLANAASAANARAVDYFVDRVDVNETNDLGQTALMLGLLAEYLDADVAATLLNRGADPNVPDHQGMTALHIASVRGNVSIVRALLGAGAEIDTRDNLGRTPLDLAQAEVRRRSENLMAIPEATSDLDDATEIRVSLIRRGKALRTHMDLQDQLSVVLELVDQ